MERETGIFVHVVSCSVNRCTVRRRREERSSSSEKVFLPSFLQGKKRLAHGHHPLKEGYGGNFRCRSFRKTLFCLYLGKSNHGRFLIKGM